MAIVRGSMSFWPTATRLARNRRASNLSVVSASSTCGKAEASHACSEPGAAVLTTSSRQRCVTAEHASASALRPARVRSAVEIVRVPIAMWTAGA